MVLKLPRKRNLGIAKFIIQFRKLRGEEVRIYLAVSYKLFGFKTKTYLDKVYLNLLYIETTIQHISP